jgi:NitT/TauT family transport system ATP-binding protein
LEEAIFLADRILIMGGTPSKITHTLEVDLPHPRTFDVLASERYLEIKKEALEVLYGDSMQGI